MSVATFRPPVWLPGGHLQTLWRKFANPVKSLDRQRQRIDLPDGDFVDLDWLMAAGSPPPDSPKPLVFLLHGLAGSSDSPYILSMQALLQEHGYDSVAMNLRGCSGTFNRLAVAYHSGCSHDVEAAMDSLLTSLAPERQLVVIGYSLGANVLVKWMSETRHQHRVAGGISVSNPFSLALCCERMKSGFAGVYGRYFLDRLRRDLQAKARHFEQAGAESELAAIRALGPLDGLRTLWDFDDAVTAPLHGFKGALDYYDRCSSRRFLPAVKQPLLIVHALNDPIIPPPALPELAELPAQSRHEWLHAGGHVGFASRDDALWLERRLLGFIDTLNAD